MSAAGDKQVRFTFAIDERSLGAAKQAIASLTSEVKKLVETTARAGQSMSMIGGGGGGLLGGVSNKAGGINPSQQAGLKGGSVLTQGIAGDARALVNVAKAGNDALRQMTSGMRSSVNEQRSALSDLRREIQQVERALKGLGGASSDSLGDLADAHGIRGGLQNRLVDLNRQAARTGAADNRAATGGYLHRPAEFTAADWDQYRPAGAGRSGWFQNMTMRVGATGAGGAQGNPFAGGLTGMAMRALGVGGLAGGMVLAGGAAGAALVGHLGGQASAAQVSNSQYNLDLGMRSGRIGARIGGSVGQLGMGIRGGDLASSMVMEQLATNGGFASRGIGTIRDRLEGATAAAGSQPTFGNAWNQAWDWAGRNTYGRMGGRPLKSHVAMGMDNAMADMSAKQAEEMAEQVRNEIASKPQLASMYNQAYGSGFGNIGTARTGGLRLGVNKKTGNTYMAEFNARALGAGYDPGAVAGARASLGAAAGRGLMGAGQYMLGLQAGGLGNSDTLYGVGAQFGGGGARGAQALMNAVQGGIGAGGVDVTAGSQVAGLVASGMAGGGFMGASGAGLMQGMLSAGYTGTPGGDMARARILGSGMGEYARNLSGGTDPLQMGINTLAANASGAKGWYAKRALMGMDPTQMLEAMRTGKMPQHLADQGLTMGNLQHYNSFRNQYAFSRYIDAEGAGTAQGAAVAGVKAAGGVGNYLHQLLGKTGAGTKAGRGIISTALSQLGTARAATEGGSAEANLGALYAEIAGDPTLTPALRGHGAGGPRIRGTIEGSVAEQEAKKAKEQGEFEAQRYDKIKVAISRMVDNSNSMAGLTKDLVENTKTFDGALTSLTTAILNNLQRLSPKEYARLQKEALDAAKAKAGAPGKK